MNDETVNEDLKIVYGGIRLVLFIFFFFFAFLVHRSFGVSVASLDARSEFPTKIYYQFCCSWFYVVVHVLVRYLPSWAVYVCVCVFVINGESKLIRTLFVIACSGRTCAYEVVSGQSKWFTTKVSRLECAKVTWLRDYKYATFISLALPQSMKPRQICSSKLILFYSSLPCTLDSYKMLEFMD